MGMTKAVQAKDISTEKFLTAVRLAKKINRYANTHHVARLLNMPLKVVMAKTTKLDRQNVIVGCGCGCGSPIWIVGEDWPSGD